MDTKTTVISQEQLQQQRTYCDKISAYWHASGRTPKAYVETYGCQQNEADSERIRGMLTESGYEICHEAEGADVVVMNTCAIRENANQRVFGNLGALTHTKRRHPDQKIFLCGCMAGQEVVTTRIKKSFPHVNGVFSTHHLWQFPEILYNVLTTGKRFDELWDQTPIRLLGVRASKLSDQTNPVQMSLFDFPQANTITKNDTSVTSKQQKLDKALDSIRGKYGKDIVKRGSLMQKKNRSET